MTYFDKNFPSPLRQMVFDYVQINRQTPSCTLVQLRQQNYEILADLYSLDHLYAAFSSLSDKSSYRSDFPIIFINEMFSDIIKTKEITNSRFCTIRDACYANFEDCLNEYEAKHQGKSTRNLKKFLSSVPTPTLWVMQCWDQQALTHFAKRFKSDYSAPFQKSLQQELLNRGIHIKSKTITDNATELKLSDMVKLVEVLNKEIKKLQEIAPDPIYNLSIQTDSSHETGSNDDTLEIIKIVNSTMPPKISSGNHGTLDDKGNET